MKFKMKTKVKCKITGFSGITIGYCEYMNGSKQFLVQPTESKNNNYPKSEWINEKVLSSIDKKKKVVKKIVKKSSLRNK